MVSTVDSGSQVEQRDNWSDHWRAFAQTASKNPAQWMRHTIIRKLIRSLPAKPDLLLDIGSGQGDFIVGAAAERVANRLIGFELSEVGVEISKRKTPDATFEKVDLFNPPASTLNLKKKADVITCCEVVEHVDDPLGFCTRIEEYLKPDGVLILTVPGGPISSFDRYIGHRKHYTKASVTELLNSSGFVVDRVLLTGFPFFNLYRLVVIARGDKLKEDIEGDIEESAKGFWTNLALRTFSILFKFNIFNFPLGWQVVAVARKRTTSSE